MNNIPNSLSLNANITSVDAIYRTIISKPNKEKIRYE